MQQSDATVSTSRDQFFLERIGFFFTQCFLHARGVHHKKVSLIVAFGLFLIVVCFPSAKAEAAIQFVGSTTASGDNAAYNLSLTGLTGGISSTAAQDDFVVVVNTYVGTADGNPGVGTAGYTEMADLYANNNRDVNFSVNYKFMTATPDTTVSCNGSATAGSASTCLAMVFRGVDLTTPMDVASTTATSNTTEDVDCPAITPVTSGSYVLCTGGGAGANVDAAIPAIAGYAHAYLQFDSTNYTSASVGAYKAWTSGAEDPAAFVMDLGTQANNSMAALTMALREQRTVSLSSASNQVFSYAQATTTISTITITDNVGASVTAANDIRIRIASTSLTMKWDTTDTTATFGGTASGKVSNPVSYENNGTTLVIPVDTNFSAGETLTVSGLSFTQFLGTSTATTGLNMYLAGGSDAVSDGADDKTIVIYSALPTLTTPTATAISSTTATLGGTIVSNGGGLTARGTCWGTTPSPVTNCVAEGGTGTGVFTQARTGLSQATFIYARAYATNATGTAYSSDTLFLTEGTFVPGTENVTAVGTSTATIGGTILGSFSTFTTATDTPEANIKALTVDSVNGVLYAGSDTNGYIYRCLLSTGCDSTGDFTIVYDTASTDMFALTIASSTLYVAAITGAGFGTIHRCLLSTGCDASGDFTEVLSSPVDFFYSFTVDSVNGVLYVGGSYAGTQESIHRCLLSTGCEDWGDFSQAYSTFVSQKIISLTIASSTLYAGTDTEGIIYRCLLSTDCDATVDYTTAFDTTETKILSLAFDSVNGVLHVGTSPNGIFYPCLLTTGCDASGDFNSPANTADDEIYSIIFSSTTRYAATGPRGVIYACFLPTGCDGLGAFTTATDTPATAIYALAIDSANNALYAGSGADGIIYKSEIGPAYPITERGTCWGTSPSPVTNCLATSGTSTGAFTHARTGLPSGTLIYARAYVTYASGTAYSADISTTTLSVPPTTLSSASNQVFSYAQATTTISTITITDNVGASVTAANDIRIRIASTSLTMKWDTTDTTATFGGTASGKVSNPVSYENNGTTLVIPVDTNFSAGETLTVSGLSFTQFLGTSTATTGLNMYLAGGSDAVSDGADDKTIVIYSALPTLTTPTATAISSTTATLGGTIVSNGGGLTARGTCWGTTPSPSPTVLQKAVQERVSSRRHAPAFRRPPSSTPVPMPQTLPAPHTQVTPSSSPKAPSYRVRRMSPQWERVLQR
ncbi:hypothetical protein IPH92_00190 [Candidatus Kaiserbacteria bacterium]|nr:MAG: hypothetical protein IPH92_00190 [Candidatus Kaiserbacteria bacterium]